MSEARPATDPVARARVSVLVASRAASPELEHTLALVREQARASSHGRAQVVLALNTDSDSVAPEARARLAALADALVFEPEPGKSRALNRGLAACTGEVVAFTDDDALPEPGWLDALVAPLLADGARGLGERGPAGAGGRVEAVPPADAPGWYAPLLRRSESTFLGPNHDLGPSAREYLLGPDGGHAPIGANCAYRRALLGSDPYRLDLGPNTQTGGRGGEDTELGLRLLAAGHRLVYVPGARVRHPVAAERTSRRYVLGAYRAHGVESVRMRRALGLPLPSAARMRWKILTHAAEALVWRPLDARRALRHELRRELYRGMLGESAKSRL